jgi:putative transposase
VELKTYKHAPAHLFIDNRIYFFTGAVYQKKRLLETARAKEVFIDQMIRFHEKYGWKLVDWSVMDNHYHFMSEVAHSRDIPGMINTLHKTSSFHIMKGIGIKVKPFWYQYWDRCIRNEDDLHRTCIYVIFNPLKHGLVADMKDYPFSSYHQRFSDDSENAGKAYKKYRTDQINDFKTMDDF